MKRMRVGNGVADSSMGIFALASGLLDRLD
jgi:hypothetical protein